MNDAWLQSVAVAIVSEKVAEFDGSTLEFRPGRQLRSIYSRSYRSSSLFANTLHGPEARSCCRSHLHDDGVERPKA